MDQITPKPVKQFKVIGTRPLRPDGIEKVTGKAIYGADLSAPNMLYGLMLRINEPHALIETIDISIAEKLPGVKSIITFKDFIKINPNYKDNLNLTENLKNLDKQLNKAKIESWFGTVPKSMRTLFI